MLAAVAARLVFTRAVVYFAAGFLVPLLAADACLMALETDFVFFAAETGVNAVRNALSGSLGITSYKVLSTTCK